VEILLKSGLLNVQYVEEKFEARHLNSKLVI